MAYPLTSTVAMAARGFWSTMSRAGAAAFGRSGRVLSMRDLDADSILDAMLPPGAYASRRGRLEFVLGEVQRRV